MYLVASSGAGRKFFYETPRPGMVEVGVKPGTLLFVGKRVGMNYFRFDIALGLMKARVRGVRRLFTEDERERIARTVVEHLRRSRWHWWREEGSIEPGYMARMPVRTDGESSDDGRDAGGSDGF